MRRSGRRTGRFNQPSERGPSPTATPSPFDPLEGLFPGSVLYPLAPLRDVTPPPAPRTLEEPFDGRLWHPRGRNRPAPTLRGSPAVLEHVPRGLFSSLPSFSDPSSVVHCIRRKQRREVLFATGRGGRGYRSRKRRTWRSNHGCS